MIYTVQSDFGYFGARWACAKTTGTNFSEHFRGRAATKAEREQISGRFLHLGNDRVPSPCYESNYKNHEDVWSGNKPKAGWGMDADPEAHGLINNWVWAIKEILDVLGIKWSDFPYERYQVRVLDVDGNPYDDKVSTHFEPMFDGVVFAHPDPRLAHYPEVEVRSYPYES